VNDDLIKKIKEEVLKTGFPLELRIADFLNRNKYYVAHSLYYIDEDENKSREVDLRALKKLGFRGEDKNKEDREFLVNHCFFIECKKSKNPWVFLCSTRNAYDVGCNEMPSVSKKNFIEKENLDILQSKHPFSNYSLMGRSYFELGKKNNENIFKAITTTVKATLYSIEQGFPFLSSTSICYYYPIVILEGRLFQGILNGNQIEVEEVNSVLLSFLYESNKRKNSRFAIPIITESEVPSFFKKMDNTLDFLSNLMNAKIKKVFPELFD
jgi:hypothetical protein